MNGGRVVKNRSSKRRDPMIAEPPVKVMQTPSTPPYAVAITPRGGSRLYSGVTFVINWGTKNSSRYTGFEMVTGSSEYVEAGNFKGYRLVPLHPPEQHMLWRERNGTTALVIWGLTLITFVKIDPKILEDVGFRHDPGLLVPCSSPQYDE
jgi:hypothetical protein